MYLRAQCRNEGLKIKIYRNTNPLFILRKKTKMHKIRHLHADSAVGILEEVGPKVQLPKGANKLKSHWPRKGWSEGAQQVCNCPHTHPTTFFACHHNPLLDTVPSTSPQDWVMSKQDVERKPLPGSCESLPQNIVAGGLGSLMWFYTCFTPCLAREISHSRLQKDFPIPATFKSMSLWVQASAKACRY